MANDAVTAKKIKEEELRFIDPWPFYKEGMTLDQAEFVYNHFLYNKDLVEYGYPLLSKEQLREIAKKDTREQEFLTALVKNRQDGIYLEAENYNGRDILLFGATRHNYKDVDEAMTYLELDPYSRSKYREDNSWQRQNPDTFGGVVAIRIDNPDSVSIRELVQNGVIHTTKRSNCSPKQWDNVFDNICTPLDVYRRNMNIKENYECAEKENNNKDVNLAQIFRRMISGAECHFHQHAGKLFERSLMESEVKKIEDAANQAVKNLEYCIRENIPYVVTENGIEPDSRTRDVWEKGMDRMEEDMDISDSEEDIEV